MKRLFFPSLILAICLLAGCESTPSALLPSPGASAEESLEALRVFHEAVPDDARGSYNYAYALTATGNYEEALKVITPLTEGDTPPLRFIQLEAYIYRATFRYRSYADTLERILSYDEANINARLGLAWYYSLTGRRTEAYNMALSVLDYDTSNAEAISILASYSDFYRELKGEEASTAETRKENTLTRPYIDREMNLSVMNSHLDSFMKEEATTVPLIQ